MKNKKVRFAVKVDELGREKLYLKRLVELLKEEYSFMDEINRLFCNKSIRKAKTGDVIIFGGSKKYDYELVSKEEFFKEYKKFPLLALQQQFAQVKKALKRFAASRYYYEVDFNFDNLCCNSSYYEVDVNDLFADEYYVVLPDKKKKAKKTKKRRNATHLEEVTVGWNHVQVGWDTYRIYENDHGDEIVSIEGDVFEIKRDSAGNGILV